MRFSVTRVGFSGVMKALQVTNVNDRNMRKPSNVILAITIGTVLATLGFGRSQMDWAIPLMLSISASPVFEPKGFNIVLTSATCTAMFIGNAANIVWVSHTVILLAAACMILAFAKYGWRRQSSERVPSAPEAQKQGGGSE